MITAGIKELKNQLSRYIGIVKKGDDVLITERGRVVARIVKENSSSSSLRQALQLLILKGQIVMPTRDIKRDVATTNSNFPAIACLTQRKALPCIGWASTSPATITDVSKSTFISAFLLTWLFFRDVLTLPRQYPPSPRLCIPAHRLWTADYAHRGQGLV